MLFSLTNLKRRSVRDPDGELAVVPKLLTGRTALGLLNQAIELFEASVGKPRSEWDTRALEAIMGDYRLGRCIEACLLARYGFEQPQLASLLSTREVLSLSERGLATPSDMRLALWDAANGRYGGFVPPNQRSAFLGELAGEWGLPADPSLLDTLLTLDSEASAVLTRSGEQPTPHDLMLLYNRGAVATLLAHSTQVVFDVSSLPGAALKRLYFIAKRRGLLVDIEDAPYGGYQLTLHGPEQAAGTADKYGRRLADVSLSLLRSLLGMAGDVEGVEATAHLTLHDRPYRFHLTSEILARLGYAPEAPATPQKGRVAEAVAAYTVGSTVKSSEESGEEPSFDSMVEARLYKEYKSLERGGYTHGWRLEREPDPLLAPGVVLIPDFAFLRGGTRVFMEIAGFWSPHYRERKMAKLRTLAAQEVEAALVLAVPYDALSTFTGLPFPVVPYKNSVRATDMLAVLDSRYGGQEERREAGEEAVEALRDAARERGFVPEGEVAGALRAYTRTELLAAAASLDGDGCRYVPGVGLLSLNALERVRLSLEEALRAGDGRVPLDDAAQFAASTLGTKQVDVEAFLKLWPPWRADRPSLFEAFLVEDGGRETGDGTP